MHIFGNNGEQKQIVIALVEKWAIFGEQFREPVNSSSGFTVRFLNFITATFIK